VAYRREKYERFWGKWTWIENTLEMKEFNNSNVRESTKVKGENI